MHTSHLATLPTAAGEKRTAREIRGLNASAGFAKPRGSDENSNSLALRDTYLCLCHFVPFRLPKKQERRP